MTVVLAIVVALLLVAAGAVYSSAVIVEEGDVRALLVFGEMKGVVGPGLHFVPPFVSETYPIDTMAITIAMGDEWVTVPEEFESDVEALTATR